MREASSVLQAHVFEDGWSAHAFLKRTLDFLVAAVLLIVTSPILILAALAVKLTSPGSVFFVQEREGMAGRRFRIYKFRSMRSDPSKKRDESGDLIKLRQDPRVTLVGRLLRSTSIDELPQLINVLLGDMSLVGPRPLIPFMLEEDPEFRRVRALVRPGITGLWQLRDRANNTTASAMQPHDLEYIENFSLALDAGILLRTIPAVLSRRGAY